MMPSDPDKTIPSDTLTSLAYSGFQLLPLINDFYLCRTMVSRSSPMMDYCFSFQGDRPHHLLLKKTPLCRDIVFRRLPQNSPSPIPPA